MMARCQRDPRFVCRVSSKCEIQLFRGIHLCFVTYYVSFELEREREINKFADYRYDMVNPVTMDITVQGYQKLKYIVESNLS